jgi:hypothetical protein
LGKRTVQPHSKPRPRFSEDCFRLCLALIGVADGQASNPVMSQRALARVPYALQFLTLKRWEQKALSGNDSQTSECASHRQIGVLQCQSLAFMDIGSPLRSWI